MSQANYSRRLRKTTLLAFLGPLALAIPSGFLLRQVVPGEQFWLVFLASLLVIGAAFWACVPWWRTMDDMQKHGHMVSWYWGGMAGGMLVLAWLVAALGLNSDQALGAVALIMGQTLGFLIFWAVWMLRQRGAGE
ncbi:hypothetical protein M3P36_04970 [Altererythrobacter sp. KTW20L]|uniref:hypothetical protein n=1 Tax=Altererythrobacter sp. KTW20L TaxID=2942210 RepID=UPI0020BEC6BC|nr:hypothetical protein [Altererythrobacter sp. KTW20L]MCL6250401.1 hypothetical protein [Altererythrobacter sp. KTW20L]